MGSDIHAMIEKRALVLVPEEGQGPLWEDMWKNAGDPDIHRDYRMFAVLANVRNEYHLPFIAEPRGIPEDATEEYQCWAEEGGHSHSWVTLAEIKAYDVTQTYFEHKYVVRDAAGKIVGAQPTPEGAEEQVGECTIFGLWGRQDWDELIATMEAVKTQHHTDDDVRLCF